MSEVSRNFIFTVEQEPNPYQDKIKYIIWFPFCQDDKVKYRGYVEFNSASRLTGVSSVLGAGEFDLKSIEDTRDDIINRFKQFQNYREEGSNHGMGHHVDFDVLLADLKLRGMEYVKWKYSLFFTKYPQMIDVFSSCKFNIKQLVQINLDDLDPSFAV